MSLPMGLIGDVEPTVLLAFEDDVEPTVLLVGQSRVATAKPPATRTSGSSMRPPMSVLGR